MSTTRQPSPRLSVVAGRVALAGFSAGELGADRLVSTVTSPPVRCWEDG